MLRRCMAAVEEFHARYGFQVRGPMTAEVGLQRLHLVTEEVSELASALADGDSLEVLDALVDLLYVVVGTAVAFGLPLVEAFEEVHRSNMTKTTERCRPSHPGKGPGYSPPRLAELLRGLIDGQLPDYE